MKYEEIKNGISNLAMVTHLYMSNRQNIMMSAIVREASLKEGTVHVVFEKSVGVDEIKFQDTIMNWIGGNTWEVVFAKNKVMVIIKPDTEIDKILDIVHGNMLTFYDFTSGELSSFISHHLRFYLRDCLDRGLSLVIGHSMESGFEMEIIPDYKEDEIIENGTLLYEGEISIYFWNGK